MTSRGSRWAATALTTLLAVSATGALSAQETAGYGRGFFVRSADGANEIRVGGTFQYRYVGTDLPSGPAGPPADGWVGGFQYRRVQVDIQGHFMGPRWTYRLRLDAANGGTIAPAHAWVAYDFPGGVNLRAGQTKPSFLHEENVSGVSQLAAERSYTADYFTTDFAQIVQLTHRPTDRLTLVGTMHTGSYSYRTDFDSDLNDVAVAGRAELVLGAHEPARAWGQLADFQSWKGEQAVAVLGAAVDWEAGESGGSAAYPDVLKWTVDLNVKGSRGAWFASAVGQRFSADSPAPAGVPADLDGARQIGLVTQATWFMTPDHLAAFARYERVDFDGVYYRMNQGGVQSGSRALEDDLLAMVTVGGTYHIRKHAAKVTVDLTRASDPVPVANTGSGLLRAAAGGQTAVRTQIQIRF